MRTPSHKECSSLSPVIPSMESGSSRFKPTSVAPHLCPEHTPSPCALSRSEGFPYLGIAYCTQDLPGKQVGGELLTVNSSRLEATGNEAAEQDGCQEGESKEGHSLGPELLDSQVIHPPGRTRENPASPGRW